jgi:hypothetical protein
MSVGTLGTNATTSLNAITFAPAQGVGQASAASILSAADLAAIANSIIGDGNVGAVTQLGYPAARGILATGSTNSNTTLNSLVATGGGGLASIQIGNLVLGVGIPPGTFVTAKPSASSVTLSQAATASASIRVVFATVGMGGKLSFNGQLEIPGRGILRVLPGDIIAIDNTGWPILVSGNAISYAGSLWTKA